MKYSALTVFYHFPIFYIENDIKKDVACACKFRRDMSQRNKQAFCDSMYGINWETVVGMTNAQQAFSAFHSEILRLYNTHIPKS